MALSTRLFVVLVIVLMLANMAALPLASADNPPQELGLCARVGLLEATAGQSVLFGSHLTPPIWSLRRDVRFQVCGSDGSPVRGRRVIEVLIEPVTSAIGARTLATKAVATDELGRFTAMYGVGSPSAGTPWPEGHTSIELHHFVLDGRTTATFRLERSARDLLFYRRR